jgi:hypothetical protein
LKRLFFPLVLMATSILGIIILIYLNRAATTVSATSTDLSPVLQQLEEMRRSVYVVNELPTLFGQLQANIEKSFSSQRGEILPEERTQVIREIVEKINQTLSEEFVKAVDAKYASAIVRSNEANGLIADFENLKKRLQAAITYLEQRGNVNLAIGIATTLGAIAGLYYIVFQGGPTDKDLFSILSHYIPRVSFVIFVEVFAYFFLRLYKNNVEDVKFYHNELTSIDAKLIALRSSFLTKDEALLKAITTTLSKVERNHILKRGETTVEIERTKLEGKGMHDSLKQMLGIFKVVQQTK